MSIKLRLTIMNFLEFAVWGAYLTSMGNYLGSIGLGPKIGLFYAMQGIVSIFMPAILGIVADRWIPVQRLLGISHALRSEEHTSELQSRENLVCRLLLEKKKKNQYNNK